MNTINISLPEKLKTDAEELIKQGHYVSFSDLVRDALRQIVSKNKYDLMAEKAMEEERLGLGVTLKTPEDIDKFFDQL